MQKFLSLRRKVSGFIQHFSKSAGFTPYNPKDNLCSSAKSSKTAKKKFRSLISSNRDITGFTLIEILVVVGIIAILATIIFVYFKGAQAKVRDSKRKGELRQIENTLVIYQDNNDSSYPNSLQDLVPNYMPKVPQDPKTGSPYSYKASSQKNYYEIDAKLEINLDGAADIDGGNQPFPVYEVGNDLTLLP